MTPLIIIGLGGYGGAGKDTAAGHLVECHGFTQRAFADKVREVATLFGENYLIRTSEFTSLHTYNELIRYSGGYEQAKRKYPEIRDYLVKIGHGLRQILGDSLWRDQVFTSSSSGSSGSSGSSSSDSSIESDGYKIVISDVRYENEAQAILDRNGIVVWIDRADVGPANATEAEEGPKVKAMASLRVHNDEGHPQRMKNVLSYVGQTSCRKFL